MKGVTVMVQEFELGKKYRFNIVGDNCLYEGIFDGHVNGMYRWKDLVIHTYPNLNMPAFAMEVIEPSEPHRMLCHTAKPKPKSPSNDFVWAHRSPVNNGYRVLEELQDQSPKDMGMSFSCFDHAKEYVMEIKNGPLGSCCRLHIIDPSGHLMESI